MRILSFLLSLVLLCHSLGAYALNITSNSSCTGENCTITESAANLEAIEELKAKLIVGVSCLFVLPLSVLALAACYYRYCYTPKPMLWADAYSRNREAI